MKKNLNLFFLFAASFLISCAQVGTQPDIYDAGIDDIDSGVSSSHPCDSDLKWSDFWNCGECGVVCSATNADQCVGGVCSCGGMESCDLREECQDVPCDCRYGGCIPTDINGENCEFDSECISGHECIEGHCTFVSCVPEVCDGHDNDCDGRIDETNEDNPLSEFCFSGRDNQNRLPCQGGVRLCVDGNWGECYGEIPPINEQGLLGCDGADNDCDGCVDGILTETGICESREPTAFDILYVIDISGSMQSTIQNVITATDEFSALFAGNNAFKFALAVFPLSDEEDMGGWIQHSDPYTNVVTDFVDLSDLQPILALVSADADSGNEPSWDAGYEIGSEQLQPLSWRADSVRIIFIFTDEQGQTYRDPPITEEIMCNSFTHGESVNFITSNFWGQDYDDCGRRFDLADPDTMRDNMAQQIQNPCL